MSKRNMYKIIENTKPDSRYCLMVDELQALVVSGDKSMIAINAFKYGYALGQRALSAEETPRGAISSNKGL